MVERKRDLAAGAEGGRDLAVRIEKEILWRAKRERDLMAGKERKKDPAARRGQGI